MIEYKEAVADKTKRQNYLSQLYQPDFVYGVFYFPACENKLYKFIELSEYKIRRWELLENFKKKQMFVPFLYNKFARKIKHPVFVNPLAFDNTKLQFCACLSHEYFHARDFYHGIELSNTLSINAENIDDVSPDLVEEIMDLRAYWYQITKWLIDIGDTKDIIISSAISEITNAYRRIEQRSPTNGLEKAIKDLMLQNYSIIRRFKTYKHATSCPYPQSSK